MLGELVGIWCGIGYTDNTRPVHHKRACQLYDDVSSPAMLAKAQQEGHPPFYSLARGGFVERQVAAGNGSREAFLEFVGR